MTYDPMAKIAAERERDRRAECFDDLLASLKDCLAYIEHSEANRGRLSNDEQWDRNVEFFRQHSGYIGIGRDALRDKAGVNLTVARATIAKAEGKQ